MAQHELDPETMARLIDSSAWKTYLRDFLWPTFLLAAQRYDGATQKHDYWQAWKLAWKTMIETPYVHAHRQSPLALDLDLEGLPAAPLAPAEETPAESPPVRPVRRTTFPVG